MAGLAERVGAIVDQLEKVRVDQGGGGEPGVQRERVKPAQTSPNHDDRCGDDNDSALEQPGLENAPPSWPLVRDRARSLQFDWIEKCVERRGPCGHHHGEDRKPAEVAAGTPAE